MVESTANARNLDSWVELRQAKESGWNHFWKGSFHEVWSFPKNSIAPDENMSFSWITVKTTVRKSNQVQPSLTRNSNHTTKMHYIHMDFFFFSLFLLGKNMLTFKIMFLLSSFKFLLVEYV